MRGRIVRFDEYEVDFECRELRKRGVRIGLQQKPFRVLELLLRHPGQLVSREELIGFLWPDSHVSFAHGLNTAVNSLRLALGESSREALFIETRPGLGYRFAAPVTEVFVEGSQTDLSEDAGMLRDAHEDCLKGRYLLDRMTAEETYKAIAFFQSAMAAEACCSIAYSGIADAYCQLALLGSVSAAEIAGKARSAAAMALRNGPDLVQAQLADGRVKILCDWDWNGALAASGRAAMDGSFSGTPLVEALLLVVSGRYADGLQRCRHAVSLDPLSFSANLQLAGCLFATRDFRATVDQCWTMLTLTPQFAPAQLILALAYEQLGMFEEAIVEFENAERCAGFEVLARSGLAHVLAVAGMPRELGDGADELSWRVQEQRLTPYGCALLHTALGQRDQVFLCLEESFRKKDPAMLWVAADPRFDGVREDERFRSLVGRVGAAGLENRALGVAAGSS